MNFVCVMVLTGLGLGAVALGEPTSAPTTAPATQASTAPGVDQALATPAGALSLQYVALARGDVAALQKVYRTDTPAERELAKAYESLAESLGLLRAAAERQWGPDGFTELGLSDSFRREIAKVAAARQERVGEDVVKLYASGDKAPPVVLRRNEAGQWQMALGDMFADPAQQAAGIRAQGQAYTELAGEISAGKYELAIDARQARHRKVKEALDHLNAAERDKAKGAK
jgi:hypothetical protein